MRTRYTGVRKSMALLLAVTVFISVLVAPAVALATSVPWFRIKAPMPTPLWGFAAAKGKGTSIWVLGGVDQNAQVTTAVHQFNPLTAGQPGGPGSWTLNVASLDVPRCQTAVTTGSTGIIYMLGGSVNGHGAANAVDTVVAIDPNAASPQAVVIGHLQVAKYNARAEMIGNTIYVAGGISRTGQALSSIEGFQLDAGGMSGTNLGTVASLPSGRWAVGTFARNGKLYIAGGRVGPFNNSPVTDETWVMDPADYSLTPGDPLPYARTASKFGLMSGGAWYDCGGLQGDVLAFDPARAPGEQWLTVGSYPNPRNRVVNVSAFGFLYTMGGVDAAGNAVSDVATAILLGTTGMSSGTVSGAGQTSVNLSGSLISVAFPAGTTPGQLTVSTLSDTPSDVPPAFSGTVAAANIRLYDIATSADTGGGASTVTLPYNGTTPPLVQHWTGAAWVDVTPVDWDQVGHTLSFQTTSFSPFAIGESSSGGSPTTSTPASSPWSVAITVALGACIGVWMLRPTNRAV